MRLLILLLGLAFLISCKKEVAATSISLGEEDGIQVTYYHYEVNTVSPFTIDFDQDGVDDVLLSSKNVVSQIIGVSPELTIEPLHSDCAMLVERTDDTTYVQYAYQSTTNQAGVSMEIFSEAFSCDEIAPNGVMHSTQIGEQLLPKSSGDFISFDNYYSSSKAFLTKASFANYEWIGTTNQGVEQYQLCVYYNDCYSFPTEVSRFVGVRINTAQGVKLGWIRFRFSGSTNLTIESWAIQE